MENTKYVLVMSENHNLLMSHLNTIKYLNDLRKKLSIKMVACIMSNTEKNIEYANYFDEIKECNTCFSSNNEDYIELVKNAEVVFAVESPNAINKVKGIGHEQILYVENGQYFSYQKGEEHVEKYDDELAQKIAYDIAIAVLGEKRKLADNAFIGTYYIGKEELENVTQIIESRSLFRYDGPNVQHFTDKLEEEIQDKFNVKYALACTNGAAALKLACIANGIGDGDEVIMSPFTFVATAASVLACGGIPVFAEFDKSMNIDAESIEALITEKTRAIICVHLQGQACDMEKIMNIAKKHSLVVIEDAAQALGAKYGDKYCGCIGDCGAFSLQAGKTITCGEGGVFVTNDYDIYIKAKMYHDNGGFRVGCQYPTWMNQKTCFGENFKLTELQSAVALAQFKKLDDIVKRQKYVSSMVEEYICSSNFYKLRKKPVKCDNVPFSVCVIFESKELNELFMNFMQKRGIPFRRYCSNLIYDFDTFSNKQGWHESNYPYNLTERTYEKSECAENIIACAAWMNLSAFLNDEDIQYVIRMMEVFKQIWEIKNKFM
ncbi:DegT/DnrJ/EryC1/StrS family aminotransferase [Cellulosilyticum ruminicola]|uniref:DegT/DnrJ/EryC1/StrS family aminotransferase n=1 Tax=Cellulosilyticum ruminicola TaxID=425254 RepID=UPI0006D00B1E|nr:DegT/DnrJ/EryC1/StrS family aminotransferase [Cellulosilyticum ruminicola]